MIGDKKGVNVPGANLKMPFISKKDHDDLLFGIQEGFDFVAASFTRTANDIREVRKILKENGGEEIQIIAKIENQQGVDNIDEIIEAADGIMIAREKKEGYKRSIVLSKEYNLYRQNFCGCAFSKAESIENKE